MEITNKVKLLGSPNPFARTTEGKKLVGPVSLRFSGDLHFTHLVKRGYKMAELFVICYLPLAQVDLYNDRIEVL
jgi:hypothetical protein